jgi:hypothetical protein
MTIWTVINVTVGVILANLIMTGVRTAWRRLRDRRERLAIPTNIWV